MRTISDVMTANPRTLSEDDPILDAAKVMRAEDVGDVILTSGGKVSGILTDRDIVIRGLAEGRGLEETTAGQLASREVVLVSPDDPVDRAVALMRDKAIRRLPVVDEDGSPVGIVSLGDLAERRDPESVLGEISAAPPNA